jgi:enamine deaminase RidA (YjgF/YER057c/UK114 family)
MGDDGILEPPVLLPPRAIRRGSRIYIPGQVGLGEDGYLVGADDPEAQADQCFANVRTSLALEGADLEHVVQMRCYFTDPRFFPAYLAAKKRHFADDGPVGTGIVVSALLVRGAGIELEAIAELA